MLQVMRPGSVTSVMEAKSRRRFEQSLASIQSAFATFDTTLMADVNRKPNQDWRFLIAVLTPIFAITILSVICITEALEQYTHAADLSREITFNENLSRLVTALQKERGMSCAFLSEGADTSDAVRMESMNILIGFREETDFHSIILSDATVISIGLYRDVTGTIRSLVNAHQIDCNDAIAQYSPMITKLINEMVALYIHTAGAALWGTIEAYNGMLIVKNYFGVVRAMGSSYFADGRLNTEDHTYFLGLVYKDSLRAMLFLEQQGTIEQILSKAFMQSDIVEKVFNEQVVSHVELVNSVTGMLDLVAINDRITGSTDSAIYYFNNVSSYISRISSVGDAISDELIVQLGLTIRNSQLYITLSCVTATLVLAICPPLTYWYAKRMKLLMMNLKLFMTQRTNDLKIEQQKTDQLLFQMIPKQIALALRHKERVSPEMFSGATVFFSEVVGFRALVAKSSPFELCNFLNHLYSRFDEVLDNYDVYKVETIGDSYMVVSGLPRTNGNLHAAEIASMALNVLGGLKTFLIEHINYEQVMIQIGIHSGPCAAGVVGVKMPRYCLFGDTVNTTARMMTSGLPNRIQLTEDTKAIIDEFGFETQERGKILVKGKTDINTFWLLSRQNFQFKINLAEADRVYNKSTYWKMTKAPHNTENKIFYPEGSVPDIDSMSL